MTELRWKQGTGKPPIGAIITSKGNIVIWQVLQMSVESPYEGDKKTWVDINVVSCPDD